jgi:hypothetical protein
MFMPSWGPQSILGTPLSSTPRGWALSELLISRITGEVAPSTHFSGLGVYQALTIPDLRLARIKFTRRDCSELGIAHRLVIDWNLEGVGETIAALAVH